MRHSPSLWHVSAGRLRWTYHGAMRLQQRALTAEVLLLAVSTFEIIESYPEDKYLPSFLVRGEYEGSVFHARKEIAGSRP